MGLKLVHFKNEDAQMTHEEFKDRLFDVLNETDLLPIADIETNDRENILKVVLTDGTEFIISSKSYGKVFLIK